MSDSNKYPTGTYVKNGVEKTANSTARAVALVFEGYKPKVVAPAPAEREPIDGLARNGDPLDGNQNGVLDIFEDPEVELPDPDGSNQLEVPSEFLVDPNPEPPVVEAPKPGPRGAKAKS